MSCSASASNRSRRGSSKGSTARNLAMIFLPSRRKKNSANNMTKKASITPTTLPAKPPREKAGNALGGALQRAGKAYIAHAQALGQRSPQAGGPGQAAAGGEVLEALGRQKTLANKVNTQEGTGADKADHDTDGADQGGSGCAPAGSQALVQRVNENGKNGGPPQGHEEGAGNPKDQPDQQHHHRVK